MRERIRKFIALVMTIVILNQLPGFDVLVAQAESIYIDTATTVSADTEDTYVFSSGGCTMTIDSGVSVAGIEVSGYDTYTIDNEGSVNSVTATAGEAILNGGYYGSIYISEGTGGGVIGNSISVGTITADGPIHLEGTSTVGTLTAANDLAGSGTVTVTDELSIPGTSTTIIVGRNTVINATNGDFVVYYNDTPYTITGGSTGNTIENNYGVYVTFETIDDNTSWIASTEVDNINSYLFPGEETGKYTFAAAEGYYFPETYADMVTTTGQATPSVIRIDEKEIQITYTVADTDSGTVQITLPALNPLEVGTGSITVSDVYVGDSYQPVVESETNPTDDVIVEYKVKGVSDETYSATAPTVAGDYVVRAILPAQGIYGELVLTEEFSIFKKEGSATFAVEDVVYGGTVVTEITSTTHDVDGALIEYKLADADETEYSPDAPTAVGSYVARLTFLETDEYNKVELTDEFAILKTEGSAELSVEDVIYGEEISVNLTSTTHDIATAVVEYMEAGADESTYTTIVPTAVGDYMIRISLAANESYNQIVKTAAFAILKAEGVATVTVENIIYGETVAPVVTSDTHDVATAVIEYKLADGADATYETTVPTAVGNYVVRATLAANESYEEVVATAEFTIEEVPEEETTEGEITEEETTESGITEDETIPEEEVKVPVAGSGSLVVADSYYGTSVTAQVTSSTNSTSDVIVEYKEYGNNDSTYNSKPPTAVGTYVARVVLPGNDSYKEVVLTDEFSIIYLPIPENSYSIIGNIGNNGYYISDVIILAKTGYAISGSLDGEYVERLTINTSSQAMTVYLMDENTGAKTNGLSVAAINIDADAPEVDADSDKIYYGDSLAVAISDDNLAGITLNGEAVEVDGTRTILELKSNGGVEEYTVVVTDTAGHTKNMVITVAAEWTKTGEIPSGSLVKLEAGQGYKLGSGNWLVDGDATTYSGNSTFYIGGDGQYTFNKQ